MKKLESSLLNMVLVLTGVAVVMGGILAYVNHLTEGPISQQKAKALADGIKSVMGVDELSVAKTDTVHQNVSGKEMTYVIYQAQDAQKKDLGAAVESTTSGFGGDLKVLVGFDPEGKILDTPCSNRLRRRDSARRPTSGSRRARRAISSERLPQSL
jgi:electron transport complex protein RnfG